MNINKVSFIVTLVGILCFIWFLVCFAIYKWGTNEINLAIGIMGSILIVGGLNSMQSSKKR